MLILATNIRSIITTLFLLVFAVLPVHAATEWTQTVTEEYTLMPGGELSVHNANGRITVEAWDRDTIHLTAEKRVKSSGGALGWLLGFGAGKVHGERYLEQLRIEVSGDRTNLNIETEYPKSHGGVNFSVQYTLKVPRCIELDLKTSNGAISVEDSQGPLVAHTSNGAITAVGIQGAVDVHTSNGAIKLRNIRGGVETETSNGSITITNPAGAVEARTSNGRIQVIHNGTPMPLESINCQTSNGSIDISLAADAEFNLTAKTSRGRISTDFPITIQGNISKKHIAGTVGHGGPEVRLKTSNGGIALRRS